MRGAQPLTPDRRDAYLREIAAALAVAGEIGDGTVARAVRDIQRRHFDAPDLGHGDHLKYR